ncbi:uncharacterized protein LOC120471315 isoform X2 [Pimephales promelas]|uniref:uncharacterized protein LOC120471315 isoform X2 n=1 Tax=Pimephales promelas TaxID=90988 RepID=UPI001955A685|nr:uncharacterized protein LOC120471315 isoform X2 [Pimephales promelas]KAG1932138.1 hypothetical protein F2P79_021330 [Pimephales promelas]
MSASADIHATLASILERFAKCALLEMSRAVEQEMTRRKMEVETLMLKLQFTESELRSARKNQSNLRSVGTQVNTSGQREVCRLGQEGGIKSIQIKEEHMEDDQWDSGPISPALSPLGPEVEDQDSFGTGTTGPARVGSDFMLTSKMKPGGLWSSPVSQEYPANSGALSLDASPLETGNMFHIISFVDTEEVEVVPVFWVKNGVCSWPPYTDEGVQRASESSEQPQESWPAHKVKIIYTANNYSDAMRKLPLVEQQNALRSQDGPGSQRTLKHKIKRNRRLLDEYDADLEAVAPQNTNLPQAPQIQPPCKKTILSASNEPSRPLARTQTGPSEPSTPPALEWHHVTLGSSSSSCQAIELPDPWPERTTPDPQSPEPAAPSLWHQEASLSCCDPFIRSLLHDLTTKQEIVIGQQMSLIRMVQDLQPHGVRENSDADCLNQRRFPIEDLRSLSALENQLRSCPETRRKVVDELGLLGGVDVKDTVWRIMKQAIKNDLAKTVNWRGVNGKTSFQSLEFKNVVIEAVRRNPTCAQITELEVEKAIIRWFHLAGDREGGRKKRTPLQDVGVEN